MQVSVEKVSSIRCRLTIVVPATDVEAAYTKQMNQVAKQANVKGFRPGKVPLSVVQERYGASVRQDAMNEVIKSSLYEALAKNNLRPVNAPEIEPKLASGSSAGADQSLEFVATFDVLPEIEKVLFSVKSLEKLNVQVSDEDVQRVVDQLVKQYTKWNVVDRAAQEKDRIVVDYYAVFDGKSDEEHKIQNFPLELGSKTMLPGFEDGLVGTKPGEEKHLKLTIPKDLPNDEKAGKPIEFVVTVKQVLQAESPKVDPAFVKQLGVKSGKEDELSKQIKESLEAERDRLVKEKLKEQVFSNLIEQNELEIPVSMIDREAHNIHDEVYPQHQHHDHHEHSEEEMNAFKDIAKKRVALGLLMSAYAKLEKITPDKARVEKRIQEIAASYENPQEVVAWLSTDERRGGIEAQILEDLVLERLIDGISTTEKTMSYAELKGIRI